MQERMIRRQELKKIAVEIGSLVLSSSDANVCRPTLQPVQDEDETFGSVDPPEVPDMFLDPVRLLLVRFSLNLTRFCHNLTLKI